MVVLELKRENNIFRESRIWKMKEMMEMIISIGELELEDIHLHQMCIRTNWIQNQIFRFCSSIHVFFFFSFVNISRYACIFFSPFLLKKETLFSFASSKEKKETKAKRWGFLDIYISLFLFFLFLINVSIFYTVVLKEKFFFFERDLSLLKNWKIRIYKNY